MAVSSSVSVPWVTTTPIPRRAASRASRQMQQLVAPASGARSARSPPCCASRPSRSDSPGTAAIRASPSSSGVAARLAGTVLGPGHRDRAAGRQDPHAARRRRSSAATATVATACGPASGRRPARASRSPRARRPGSGRSARAMARGALVVGVGSSTRPLMSTLSIASRPPARQPRHELLVVVRVAGLVGVQVGEVEGRLRGQRLERVERRPDPHLHPVRQARALDVRARDLGPALVELAAEQGAVRRAARGRSGSRRSR